MYIHILYMYISIYIYMFVNAFTCMLIPTCRLIDIASMYVVTYIDILSMQTQFFLKIVDINEMFTFE
jgi:hypothetical protein